MGGVSIFKKALPYIICALFVFFYATLSLIRHNHFESYGFDLGVSDQVIWQYSHFQAPITTVHYYPYASILTDHIELIYAPLSVFYWLWNDVRMILIVQAAFLCFSGLPLFFLAREKKIKPMLCYALLLGYLMFYGLQNALWFDVHSAVFGASFLAWFIYFLDKKNYKLAALFFILTIICKENMAMLTFLVSTTYFIMRRDKRDLFFPFFSCVYLFLIFGIYFPHFTERGYEYQSTKGLLGDINLLNFVNTPNKREVFLVSLGNFGFLPFLSPLSLIPFFGDLFSYFVIGNNIKEADGIFMHYRVTLAALLTWSTILAVTRVKRLNNISIALYLVLCAFVMQYALHLPLSYLTKSWFWTEQTSVQNIDKMLTYLPADASVVAQNNISPHIAHRKEVFTAWPTEKKFVKNSPCGKEKCHWIIWKSTTPRYFVVDTSNNWDIRHFLADRKDFIDAVQNMEKAGFIKKKQQVGNAVLYDVLKQSPQ